MSPVPVAGTYRRSADKVHDQRQVLRKRRAESSGGDSGLGPGPGGRSGRGGGVSGLAAACLEIPCSLDRNLWVGRGYVVPRIREFGC